MKISKRYYLNLLNQLRDLSKLKQELERLQKQRKRRKYFLQDLLKCNAIPASIRLKIMNELNEYFSDNNNGLKEGGTSNEDNI